MKKVSSVVYLILTIMVFIAIIGVVFALRDGISNGLPSADNSISVNTADSDQSANSSNQNNSTSQVYKVLNFTVNGYSCSCLAGNTWSDWFNSVDSLSLLRHFGLSREHCFLRHEENRGLTVCYDEKDTSDWDLSILTQSYDLLTSNSLIIDGGKYIAVGIDESWFYLGTDVFKYLTDDISTWGDFIAHANYHSPSYCSFGEPSYRFSSRVTDDMVSINIDDAPDNYLLSDGDKTVGKNDIVIAYHHYSLGASYS